jgi:hypothetical protein
MRLGTTGLAAVLLAGIPGPSPALEKVSARAPDDGPDGWNGTATTVRIAYYNLCSGWAWSWSGLQPGERVGMLLRTSPEPEVSSPTLLRTEMYFATGLPSGYGFTGTVSVRVADGGGCPTGTELATQPLLPQMGANVLDWNTLVPTGPPGWVLLFTNGPESGLPLSVYTDRPAGPPGPVDDCGVCYPASRTVHSFQYGTAQSPLCPGEPFVDVSGCGAELVWNAYGYFAPWWNPAVSAPGSVEPRTWGSVKNLYR